MKKTIVLCLLGSLGSLPAHAIKFENKGPETQITFGMEIEVNNVIARILNLYTMDVVGQRHQPLSQNAINSIKESFPAGVHYGLLYFTAQAEDGEVVYCAKGRTTSVFINAQAFMAPFRNLTLEYKEGKCSFRYH